jgi:hypothetical protein
MPLEIDFIAGLDREGRNVLVGFEKPSTKMDYSTVKAGA